MELFGLKRMDVINKSVQINRKEKIGMNYIELKEKRKKYNISQTKLAENSGFSKAEISSWELGKRVPTDREIAKIDKTLKKIIEDIDNCVFDIRKKRIIHSKKQKRMLPPVIQSALDYQNQLSAHIFVKENNYRDKLSDLYRRAKIPKDMDAPKAIALFSGCGGLSLGFAAEGFRLVGHVEIEDAANRIYEENFLESDRLGHDICNITDMEIKGWIEKYGEIDVVIGGPPCQGFSLAGKRDPYDKRNQLYTYYVHMVSILKPKVFVMENVRLLTSMQTPEGYLFIDCIIKAFSEVGYSVIKQEVNAYDYGVPQSRERVILIGIRRDMKKPFVFPEGEYKGDFPSNSSFETKRRLTFRDATLDLEELESGEKSTDPLHWSVVHPEHVIRWLINVPEGGSAHDNVDSKLKPPSGFNTTYKRIVWDEPCSTISTNFSMISGCRNVHPTSTRSLTIREALRAQSFPDEFIFVGNWGEIRKAIGNAVPPILASVLAREILKQYFLC